MRKKGAIRSRLNIRTFRSFIFKILIGPFPPLRRLFDYYSHTIYAGDLEEEDLVYFSDKVRLDFKPSETADILSYNSTSADNEVTFYAKDLRDIVVLGNSGSVVKDGRVVSRREDWIRTDKTTNKPYLFKPVQGDGRYINCLGFHRSHNHIYHFFLDIAAPLLIYLHKSGDTDALNIIVRPDLSPFQRDFFDALMERFPHINILPLRKNEKLLCSSLIYINCECKPRLHLREHIEDMKTMMLKHYGIKPVGGRRVYISRQDARVRHVLNEDALMEMLDGYGFERHTLAPLPYPKQVELFADAEIIISPHGAGLVNLLYCQTDVKIIEMFSSKHRDEGFIRLAKSLGMQHYRHMICQTDSIKDHFECDIDAVEALLKELTE